MKTVATVAEVRAALTEVRRPIGLVPTMGYLHEGHLSLIRKARADARTVVVSIFVNPTQFGPGEDFARYPRDVPRDVALCAEAGVDLIFAPEPSEIYPVGFTTYVQVEGLQDRWEGASRPDHFKGVATVVAKLFRIVRPDLAYFGEKDYQQLQVVGRLAADLNLDVSVVGCPTVRESDGLAMSSRNIYLDPTERQSATILHRALRDVQSALSGGQRSAETLVSIMRDAIRAEPGVDVDYVAVVDPRSLKPIVRVDHTARALIAARVGSVRLIDNMELDPPR